MANSIGDSITKVTSRLDKIIEQESTTSFLNMNQDLLGEYRGNGVIELPKLTMDGLGDYNRQTGFPAGSVSLEFDPYKMQFDRGREFEIDNIDDEERALIVSANLMAEFTRLHVIPEIDAIRYARLSELAGTKVEETLDTPEKAKKSIETAEECLQDHGKALSECTLCLTSSVKTLLRNSTNYVANFGQNPNTNIQTFDDMTLNVIAKDRFFTAIETLDGVSEGETDGGFKKAADGRAINYIAVHPAAAAALQKYEKTRYFSPDENQSKDAHKFQYRLYHDLIVLLQQSGLIYVSYAAA